MIYLGLAASTERRAAIVDRKGAFTPLDLASGANQFPSVSPRGDEVAFMFEHDLWVYSLDGDDYAV